jgi:hypothetical protein
VEYGEIKLTITQNQRAAKNYVDQNIIKSLLGAAETFIVVSNRHRLTGASVVDRNCSETLLPMKTRPRGQLMKSRHNTRQNRPIVNVTDDTSDALRSSTHACAASLHRRQPDCKQWQGHDERQQKHQRGWCSMAILTIFTAGYGTVAADGFKSLKIRG